MRTKKMLCMYVICVLMLHICVRIYAYVRVGSGPVSTVELVEGNVFKTRIYPIAAWGTRRVRVLYQQNGEYDTQSQSFTVDGEFTLHNGVDTLHLKGSENCQLTRSEHFPRMSIDEKTKHDMEWELGKGFPLSNEKVCVCARVYVYMCLCVCNMCMCLYV